MRRKINLGPTEVTICIRTLRKSCEHFCFLGATVDAVFALVHVKLFMISIIGKLAFAVGAFGVYMLHTEEHLEREVQPQSTS